MLCRFKKCLRLISFTAIALALVACSRDTFTVTAQPGPNGTISPSTPQSVGRKKTMSFTVTPASGYGIESVTGCNGILSGNTFTTGPINADCMVSATFAAAEMDAQRLFSEYNRSVVIVEMFDHNGERLKQGSGFIVRNDGLVATNHHVIQESRYIRIRRGSAVLEFERVVNMDEEHDLVLLQVKNTDLHAVRLGDLDKSSIGEKVFVISSPRGFENSISDGILSSVRDIMPGIRLLQITAPISPGSSGGPVFNKMGEVIGIATIQWKDAQNLNFAVSVNALRDMIPDTPSAASSPAQTQQGHVNPDSELLAFADNFCRVVGTRNVNLILSYYDDRVDYYAKGFVGKSFIRKDKESYFKHWTTVISKIDGKPKILEGPDTNTRIIQFRSDFLVENEKKTVTGKANNALTLRRVDGRWKIVGEKQQTLYSDKKDIQPKN